ncbi:flagellar protein FlaG [Salinimonas marina]|uniref:Flagellar protein FlaG n=1 Tax=Salinimonas marina TaxID=2785918 RepID=A0A7S9DW02_9ALTE|nr:flagellar protein FlaG [Salinimonas marina]QPG04964.1 flagellar protein FlaG [Salinimonas marina]
MDIISVQSGQKFAVSDAQSISVTPIKSTTDSTANTDESSGQKARQNVQGTADLVDKELSKPQEADIDVAVEEIESFLQIQNRNLAFSVDEETKRSVVTVKDSASGDVIRQIPSEEVLRLAERIKDLQQDIGSSVGVLINNKV